MKLSTLLEKIPVFSLDGNGEVEVKGLAYDSRKVQPGYLFVAIKGYLQNGHDFLDEAVKNGAVALVGEEFRDSYGKLLKIRVPDSREALSKIAAKFYEEPYNEMDIIGITGTNGKTTTSYMIESILLTSGASPGVIGTINSRFKGKITPSAVTTPQSLDLMRLLREMADGGVTHAVLEVSSHALDQKRIGDCPFKVAVFTNFSRDHLDYHKTMEEYFYAKSLLFRGLKRGEGSKRATAVINTDDPRGEALASLTNARVLTYGLRGKRDFSADSISSDKSGLRGRLITPVGEAEIRSSLIGLVNIYNILAAAAASFSLGVGLDSVVEGIRGLKNVPGRLELVDNKKGLTVVVDYAHTPEALLEVQQSLRPMTEGRLITLFGCGGDRDRGKRYDMGVLAAENSDVVIITSDNPRSEDPESIMREIEEGVKQCGLSRAQWSKSGPESPAYLLEVDRHKAIEKAISMANKKDLILIAGKGHEDYQIVGREKRFFDDRKEAAGAANRNDR